jgi:DNA-3-methyladenine glycosylase
MTKISRNFYLRKDVVEIARDLLGKCLVTRVNGEITSGIIVETEAYCGASDKASHAYPNKITRRNSVMFEDGGLSYVYLIYGIHYLFNIVTNTRGNADAVLIRALEPLEGIDIMKKRRNKSDSIRITSGPGSLSQALGISLDMYGLVLTGDTVWLEEDPNSMSHSSGVAVTTRIGVDYAGEDALLPWRFYLSDNPWISKK